VTAVTKRRFPDLCEDRCSARRIDGELIATSRLAARDVPCSGDRSKSLALETVGPQAVEETIGVEPNGDAFNSIRLNSRNRPFNAMVNAGCLFRLDLKGRKTRGVWAHSGGVEPLCRSAIERRWRSVCVGICHRRSQSCDCRIGLPGSPPFSSMNSNPGGQRPFVCTLLHVRVRDA